MSKNPTKAELLARIAELEGKPEAGVKARTFLGKAARNDMRAACKATALVTMRDQSPAVKKAARAWLAAHGYTAAVAKGLGF
jgi:hypothetical protein